MNSDILNHYVCLNPFNYLEIHKNNVFPCCPTWMNFSVGTPKELKNIWNNEQLKLVQNSIIDGTYSFCDKTMCPYISELLHNNVVGEVFIPKTIFNQTNYIRGPKRISFCFDYSCNLKCPSCRKSLLMENIDSQEEINKIFNDIMTTFGDTVTYFSIAGTAEPFASKTFKNFLLNFNNKDFPQLSSIYLQTNGTLLTKDMWNKMKNIRNIITMIGVSIDAATKETYSIIRGGDWEKLMENISFISSLSTPKTFSFVVQDTNYKEMELFYDLIRKLNPRGSYSIYFSKIANWGTYTDIEFKQKQIWSEEHIEFKNFLTELQKVAGKYGVMTNMNDIIQKYSLLKTKIQLI